MKEIKQTSRFPIIISILFIVQFIFFAVYYLNNKHDRTLFIFSIGILLIGLFLILSKFQLVINESYLEYSIFPIVKRKIEWSKIKEYKVSKVSALNDFSGWGIRYSFKYGWGYIFDSDSALTIYRTNGKKLTFSINNDDEIITFLKRKNILYK